MPKLLFIVPKVESEISDDSSLTYGYYRQIYVHRYCRQFTNNSSQHMDD